MFEIVDLEGDCYEGRTESQTGRVGRFVIGDGSMTSISIGSFGCSRKQQRLRCIIRYKKTNI